jgi:hypothetical protein
MSIEAGGRAGMVAPDDTTIAYMRNRPFGPKEADWDAAVAFWRSLPTDDGATFDREVIQAEIPHGRPSGMEGFVFNTRRDIFKDWRNGDQRRQSIFSTYHFVTVYFYVHRGIPQQCWGWDKNHHVCCDAAYHLQLCEREQNNKNIQKGDR